MLDFLYSSLSAKGAQGRTGFESEFVLLAMEDQRQHANAAVLCSMAKKFMEKNRYHDILPYDEARVKLQVSDPQVHSDYINASHLNV